MNRRNYPEEYFLKTLVSKTNFLNFGNAQDIQGYDHIPLLIHLYIYHLQEGSKKHTWIGTTRNS
jgi:hypothetical protein